MFTRPLKLPAIFLACGIMAGHAAYADTDFDRFFTDKRTRLQLDQAREQHSFISPRGNTTTIDNVEELVLPDVRLDGMIIRNDGSTEVWINSSGSSHEGGLGDKVERSAKRTKDGGVRVTLPTGKTVTLKPGQVYSMESEHVREAYENAPPSPPANQLENTGDADMTESASHSQPYEQPAIPFDESTLVGDPDAKIKLLEERVQKLEQTRTEN